MSETHLDKVQQLRARTGKGLKACREALKACEWDVEKAATLLGAK